MWGNGGAGDSWGRDYVLVNTTHSSAGTKTCFFLSRYVGKAGSMAMSRGDFYSDCGGALSPKAAIEQSVRILKPGLIYRARICATK